jgi:hypothetical protein
MQEEAILKKRTWLLEITNAKPGPWKVLETCLYGCGEGRGKKGMRGNSAWCASQCLVF